MKHVSLGGLDVSRIGLGAMTMAGIYTTGAGLDDDESIRTIHRALDLGVTHIDTADIYGPFHSEELVGRAIKDHRDQVVVATKFGLVSHSGGGPGVVDSSPANIRAAIQGSLKRLRTDHIDLYYQHRVDRNTPIDEAVGTGVGATPAQIGLAWLLVQGDDIAPIPGTRRVARVEENTAADSIKLSAKQVERLNNLTPATGERHSKATMASIDR